MATQGAQLRRQCQEVRTVMHEIDRDLSNVPGLSDYHRTFKTIATQFHSTIPPRLSEIIEAVRGILIRFLNENADLSHALKPFSRSGVLSGGRQTVTALNRQLESLATALEMNEVQNSKHIQLKLQTFIGGLTGFKDIYDQVTGTFSNCSRPARRKSIQSRGIRGSRPV
ncbi:unnamed protein product [Somion occarium]|uniref:Uncharacterized protein n=1 Tax=Somion occarium TaxID=3059160 RepID=A0ABP1E898_9APHY